MRRLRCILGPRGSTRTQRTNSNIVECRRSGAQLASLNSHVRARHQLVLNCGPVADRRHLTLALIKFSAAACVIRPRLQR